MNLDWDRRIIPRWRSSRIASLLPETDALTTSPAKAARRVPERALVDVLDSWTSEPTLGLAADLLSFSHLPSLWTQLQPAARFILASTDALPPSLVEVAQSVVRASTTAERADLTSTEHSSQDKRGAIRLLKSRVGFNPRDSLAYIDLARLYAALGQNDKARRAADIASTLKPDHRFILRSTSRLLLHDHDPERALHLLESSARTRLDPWLLASTIAIETVVGRKTRHLKSARRMLGGGSLSPLELSELNSAVATIALLDGSVREARKLFNAALVSPNDNSVAQAVWAANKFKLTTNLRDEWFNNAYAGEANLYERLSSGDFKGATSAADQWHLDEPFSTRPLRAATFSTSITEDYEETESFARLGLKLEPTDLDLQNDLAFALSAQGKTVEAEAILLKVVKSEIHDRKVPAPRTLANIGMLLYRTGDREGGERFYEAAVNGFEKERNAHGLALGLAYWLSEANWAGLGVPTNLLERAEKATSSADDLPARAVLQSIASRGLAKDIPVPQPRRQESVWSYDPASNVLTIKPQRPFPGHER